MHERISSALLRKSLFAITESSDLNLFYGVIQRSLLAELSAAANFQQVESGSSLHVVLVCTEHHPSAVSSRLPSSLLPLLAVVDFFTDTLRWDGDDENSLKNGLYSAVQRASVTANWDVPCSGEPGRFLVLCDSLSLFLQHDSSELYRDLARLSMLNGGKISLLSNIDPTLHSETELLALEKHCDAVIRAKSCVYDDSLSLFDYLRSQKPAESNDSSRAILVRCYECEVAYRSSARRPTKRSVEFIGVQISIDAGNPDPKDCKFKLLEVRGKRAEKPSKNFVKIDSKVVVPTTESQNAVATKVTKEANTLETLSTNERAARSRVRLPFEFSEEEKRATLERERRLREGEAVRLPDMDSSEVLPEDPDADLYH